MLFSSLFIILQYCSVSCLLLNGTYDWTLFSLINYEKKSAPYNCTFWIPVHFLFCHIVSYIIQNTFCGKWYTLKDWRRSLLATMKPCVLLQMRALLCILLYKSSFIASLVSLFLSGKYQYLNSGIQLQLWPERSLEKTY